MISASASTIENSANIRAFHVFPPKDFQKWAEICEHIIMHYNEGWANGFHYGIKYFEVWFEPDVDFDPNNIKALQTEAPYVADRLFNAKKEIWNEALSALGVPVTDRVKRERLLAAEIAGDKAASVAQQFTRLNPRKKACEQINKMFGLDLDVTYRRLDDLAMLDEELMIEGVAMNPATASANDIQMQGKRVSE